MLIAFRASEDLSGRIDSNLLDGIEIAESFCASLLYVCLTNYLPVQKGLVYFKGILSPFFYPVNFSFRLKMAPNLHKVFTIYIVNCHMGK